MSLLHFTRRGQPLAVLVALMGTWTGLRFATWEYPFELRGALAEIEAPALAPAASRGPSAPASGLPDGDDAATVTPAVPGAAGSLGPALPLPGLIPAPLEPRQSSALDSGGAVIAGGSGRLVEGVGVGEVGEATIARMAVGHALLAMMGLSQMQVPPMVAALVDLGRRAVRGGGDDRPARLARSGEAAPQPVPPVRLAASASPTPLRRWSADSWLLVREGGTARATAAEQASYGRSQVGAVVRYRLAPSSGHAPQAYARASTALDSPRDAELAAGLSARPLPRVPLRLAAEVRVADLQRSTQVRPAAYVVTEFPPLELPYGARGEAYAQAGYVGGEFATAFVDGQLRVSRDVARLGDRASLSAGAAAWGGAQEGASRLDVGPSAALSFSIGEVFSRLSVDYRVRVAGDAEPASGPALTLSAGF